MAVALAFPRGRRRRDGALLLLVAAAGLASVVRQDAAAFNAFKPAQAPAPEPPPALPPSQNQFWLGFLWCSALLVLNASLVSQLLLPVAQSAFAKAPTQQPRSLREVSALSFRTKGAISDPRAEFEAVITRLQDVLLRPIDHCLPGNPFKYDFQVFPMTPTVLIIGNHSSGKSTFINQLMGTTTQETGLAPCDDGFTVLQRHPEATKVEDGPTTCGCTENRPFRELKQFGPIFVGHLRRKWLRMPEESTLPFGLQVVDTPGMLDTPSAAKGALGRGYNFVQAVRWWAKRADLILLLFDTSKPGTTGETLEVLTKSLAGYDHKFLIVLNKADQLDHAMDFAHVYGTLGWALSKVIPQKDLPRMLTMCNEGFRGNCRPGESRSVPIEDFLKRREQVIKEVYRAKGRHWDNVVTSLEEIMRQIAMMCTMTNAVRRRALAVLAVGTAVLMVVWVAAARLLYCYSCVRTGSEWSLAGLWLSAVAAGHCSVLGLRAYCRQFHRLQESTLDVYFEKAHAHIFVHTDGEDVRARWTEVKPRLQNIMRSIASAAELPGFAQWEISAIATNVEQEMPYLRQLARQLREDA